MSASLALPSLVLRQDHSFAVSPVRDWGGHVRSDAAGRNSLQSALLHFVPDASIYAEGDEAVYVYKVISGMVRTCKFQNDGRRHIEAFHQPGDIFGFELGNEHTLSAETVTGCVILPYRRRVLEAGVGHDEILARQLYAHAMCALERTRQHAQLLGRGSAPQKLASFLLSLTETGRDEVELAMTRQDIADYLGLTIETVSRTLAALEREGVIRLLAARRIALVDRAALRRLCG